MITFNRPQPKRLVQRSRQLGMTLMEMIVAITIILTIMTGVVWSFVELLESHDKSRARMDATANARAAMEMLSTEVKRARNTTGTVALAFTGRTDSVAGNGDRVNQDQDADTDEELLDGADNDGDWIIASDRHAIIPAGGVQYAERPVFYQQPDLGDAHIDEDLGATSATVEFDTFDVPGEPLDRRVRFYIGTDAEGTPNTLMRELTGTDPTTSSTVTTSGPVCYNVASFGLLFWDHSQAKTATANPWQTEWPVSGALTVAPSTVYARISVYAGTPIPLNELPATTEIETVTLISVINVEAVLADPTYVAQRTPVTPAP